MNVLQTIMDVEAGLGNQYQNDPIVKAYRDLLIECIVELRGTVPRSCWGLDDCSTMMLSTCPWRHDCDSIAAVKFYEEHSNDNS